MARTAPIPNIPAIPGMCPGIAVLGGGGGSGGSSGKGAGSGGGGVGAGSEGGADGTASDGRSTGSPDNKKYPDCGTRSCPVDVITGRVFTLEADDLTLPGPLPMRLFRVYSSAMRHRDVGLGYGWAHSLGWEIEVRRREIRVWNDQGAFLTFDPLAEGAEQQGRYGWVLRRHKRGYVLDTDEGTWRYFEQRTEDGKCWRLSRIVDRNGNTITLSYNEHGHLNEVSDSVGRIVRTCPDNKGRFQRLQLRNAETRGQWVNMARYEYDAAGHLLSATDADGFANHYAYTAEHRLIQNGYKCGIIFNFTYDELGRCTESWGAYRDEPDRSIDSRVEVKTLSDGTTPIKGVHHCRYDYYPDNYTEVHDSTRTTYYQGNPTGLLDRTVIGEGVVTTEYREDGFVMARTDELGSLTMYQRDARGRVTSVTDPLGHTTIYDRDNAGLVVRMTDPEGAITDVVRDERGNICAIHWPDESTEGRRYDPRGMVTELLDANGAVTRMTYDVHANVVSLIQPNGGQWGYQYDALGRRLSASDPTGTAKSYSYTTRGDLVAIRDALGGTTRYNYDGDQQLLEYSNPHGAITKLHWAGLHKLVKRIDANGNAVQLRYNHEGELLRVINEAGEMHELHLDSSGELTGETTFDGRELRYSHDLAGRLTRMEDGGQEWTDVSYDAAGRMVARLLSDGTEEVFGYNARGELIRAENAAGFFTFERDTVGRIVRELQRVLDEEHWVEIQYDGEGERIGRRTSLGHSESITRDGMGSRLRTQLDGEHGIIHLPDLLGREASRDLRGGGRIESQYDALGRLSKRITQNAVSRRRPAAGEPDWVGDGTAGGGTQASYRYGLGGELLAVQDTIRGNTEYRYDPVGQLLAMVPEQAKEELFKYDRRGNMAEVGAAADERVYGAGNRLERTGDTDYVWDSDGRLIEKRTAASGKQTEETWRYEWNGAGLLQTVKRPDGVEVRFAYDPFARRVSKTVYRRDNVGVLKAREYIRFVWDGDVLAHEIRRDANAQGDPVVEERTYLYEDESFVPLAHRQNGKWVHYVNDAAGTPERLLDDAGNVVCEMRRTAWGLMEVEAGATADTALRFQGQYADQETGLSYNRWRYYDAQLGRFVTADPIGLTGGLHSYMPMPNLLAWTDPLGLAKKPPAWARKLPRDMSQRDAKTTTVAQAMKDRGRPGGSISQIPKHVQGATVEKVAKAAVSGEDPDITAKEAETAMKLIKQDKSEKNRNCNK